MLSDASKAQNAAADPDHSTWLSANAGSGKTRVLTDRVARLLLRGADPQNILCLTYTKAAAGEMQNRLFSNLGEWAMLSDERLSDRLAALGEEVVGDLAHARTLFARAIETPGGLKIQTIHSFCSALLRQFPLEAGVSPGFVELDEPGQRDLIEQVLDQIAGTEPGPVRAVARIFTGESLVALAKDIAAKREHFSGDIDRDGVFDLFGVERDADWDVLLSEALSETDLAFLKSISPLLLERGKKTDAKLGAVLADLPERVEFRVLETLEAEFVVGSGPNAGLARTGKLPTKDLREGAFAPHLARFDDIMERVAEARLARFALDAAEKTAALHAFAAIFLPAYQQAKTSRGVVDFDDLIRLARELLSDRAFEWVLFRLDARIDHILVDEAQDTSPGQWSVIAALAEEIASGEGSRANVPRSLFVVGDKKQSIYSFQGADARAFDDMAESFHATMKGGRGLARRELLHSFRSSRAILSVVDATFDLPEMTGVGAEVRHRAFHGDFPGRIDVWPLLASGDDEEDPPWHHPVDRTADHDPAVLLADKIAKNIQGLLESGSIPSKNGKFRRVRPRDILILVQRRSKLFDQLIRACKALGLPMAGADLMKIGGELAVRDILATLSFLALPEDDLSLATALRSPLFGWSEGDLYALAAGRSARYLWAELRNRRDDYAETVGALEELRDSADFLRPFELIELILTRFDGRRKLLARLGPEAEDGIDELLNFALRFERDTVPSLTAFVAEAHAEEIEIKRRVESSGDLIRIMTIHGAKGLESEIVFLPDTVRADRTQGSDFVITEDGLPVWSVSNNAAPPIVSDAKAHRHAADTEERHRLLYVAMTRAKSWLIVCGVAPKQNSRTKSWHQIVSEGVVAAGGAWQEAGGERLLRYEIGAWSAPEAEPADLPEPLSDAAIPAEFLSQAAPEAIVEPPVSPSDLGGAKVIAGDGGLDEGAAKRRGRLIHRLLEHLPGLPQDRWKAAASTILTSGPDQAGRDEISKLLEEAAQCILSLPDLFSDGALTEVDIAAPLEPLNRRMVGTVDRLVLRDDEVVIVDFKTNAIRPQTPEACPEGVLRQMGAYLEAAQSIWPSRRVTLVILWTVDATAMTIPHNIVSDALVRATSS